MKVGDILRKKTARISTIRMNETVAIAAQLMRAGNVSALVVKDVVWDPLESTCRHASLSIL